MRLLSSSVLVVALLFAPLASSGSASAAAPHTLSSMSSHGDHDHDHDGHKDTAKGLVHCGSFFCSPSYVAACPVDHVYRPVVSLSRTTAVDDPLLRSLCLDCDPPVPRGDRART